MKTNLKMIVLAMVVGALAEAANAALTMPQAPAVYYGYIRDEYGTPMKTAQQVSLELVREDAQDGRVYARRSVGDVEMAGLNYRLSVEIDSASGGRENAVTVGTRMFLRALQGESVETLSPSATITVAAPGEVRRLDYTIGTDADGDGMPDAWEQWELALNGRASGDAAVKAFLPGADADGDGMTNLQEYLAGTDPFLQTDIVKITSFEIVPGTGRAKVTFNTAYDRTFRVVASAALDKPTWVPVATAASEQGELVYETIAGDGYEKTVYIAIDAEQPTLFVRVAVN